MSSTRFILVRHGKTSANHERRFAGSTDVELTGEGRDQARALARRLRPVPIDVMFSSPLTRCLQTAEPITDLSGRKPVVCDDIHECRFGDWENMTVEEILEVSSDGLQRWLADETICPPNGESWSQLGERVMKWWHQAAERYDGRTVLAVTHGGPILWLGRHVTGGASQALSTLFVEPASVSMIQVSSGRTRIRMWNDTTHIADPLLDGRV